MKSHWLVKFLDQSKDHLFKNLFKIVSSPTLKVILSNKNYYKLATNTFTKYSCANFENLHLLKVIQIDFKYWTKENWEAINSNT